MHHIQFQAIGRCHCSTTASDILHVCDINSKFIFLPTFCHTCLFSFFTFHFHFILMCFLLRFLISDSFFSSVFVFLSSSSSSTVGVLSVGGHGILESNARNHGTLVRAREKRREAAASWGYCQSACSARLTQMRCRLTIMKPLGSTQSRA